MEEYLVFTDGACANNGRRDAKAGYGVFFGDDHPLNESGPVDPATNQRAELTALSVCLDKLRAPEFKRGRITVYSDSMYAINVLTRWGSTWMRNGWMTVANKPVLNRDIIEPMLGRLSELQKDRLVLFKHVRSHRTAPLANTPEHRVWYGNAQADALATRAV